MPVQAQPHGPLQHWDGPLHVSLALIHHTDPIAYLNQAEGTIDGLGDPQPFFGYGEPLGERPKLGVAGAQPAPGACRDDVQGAKAFIEQVSPERHDILLQTLDGPRVVAHIVIDPT